MEIMEDTFVADCLKEWGLEELIEEFDRQKIDRETFLSIPEEGIKQIIQLVGWRYTFLRKREEYLTKNAMPTNDPIPIASTNTNSLENNTNKDTNNDSSKQIDIRSNKVRNKTTNLPNESDKEKINTSNQSEGQVLKKLLNASLVGQCLLEKANCLDATDRCDLVRIIIEHQMFINLKINREQFVYWADQIVSVFPKERSDTYYIPYKKDETAASGKLYDKFTNLSKKLRAINFSKKKSNEKVTTITTFDRSDVGKLKNVSSENHGEIKELWIKTHSLRMIERKEVESISCYFDLYPMLTNSIGPSLINLDFINLYNFEDEYIFMKIWPELSYKLIHVAQQKTACKNILKSLDSDTTVDIKSLIILPYLFRPTQAKSETGKKWTPTYKEQADSFILFIDHMNDLQKSLEDRIKQLRKHRNSSQPFIIAVGNPKKIDACYVIIETVKYKYQNIFTAVDTCFKSFFAFDLKYPVESKLTWIFLERTIYGLNKTLKTPPVISSLLSDLESVNVEASVDEESSD